MKNYFAPEVEILDVMVEKGFEASGSFDFGGNDTTLPDE